MVSKRKDWIDTVKLLAIFMVFLTHFIAYHHPDYFKYWGIYPWRILLHFISGNNGVKIFGIILGYFAYNSKEKNTGKYVCRRYLYFVFMGLLINVLYAFVAQYGYMTEKCSIKDVVIESLRIGDGIFPTYWCMFPFFVGSVICFVDGKAKVGPVVIASEMAILCSLGQLFGAICLWGGLLAWAEKSLPIIKTGWMRVLLFVIGLFGVTSIETPFHKFLDSFFITLLLFVVINSDLLKRVLANKYNAFFPAVGKNATAIFLIHSIIYIMLGDYLFSLQIELSYNILFVMVFIVCFMVTIIASFVIEWLIKKEYYYSGSALDWLYGRIDKLIIDKKIRENAVSEVEP